MNRNQIHRHLRYKFFLLKSKFGSRTCLGLVVTFMLTASVGCQDSEKLHNVSGPIRVLLPWVEDNRSQLVEVEVKTISDVRLAKGGAAEFYLSPGVENNRIVGRSPRLRVLKSKSDLYVPQDTLSAQVLAMYTHIERLMFFDNEAGVGEVNQWPRQVGIKTVLIGNQGSGNGQIYDQAVYSGALDAMLFTPYIGENLPLTMNPGVVAHEHFHSLFFKLVLKPLGGHYLRSVQNGADGLHASPILVERLSNEQIYEILVLRAINEGLADVWGWLYSGDVDFVFRSLPQVKTRLLTQKPQKSMSPQIIRGFISRQKGNPLNLEAMAYEEGEKIAKTIVRTMQNLKSQKEVSPTDLAKIVVGVLKQLQQTGAKETFQKFSFNDLFSTFALALKPIDPNSCQFLVDEAQLTKEVCP